MAVKIQDPIQFNIRKDALLNHARRLFASKGFAETSMDDIAQVCHIQKASLYHYFKSKQQLLQELVDTDAERWWGSRLKDYSAGRDLRETLTLIARTFLEDMDHADRRDFFKIIHFESYKNPAILQALKDSPTHNRKGFYAVFARHLEGLLPQNQIAMFMTQFMGGLIHYASLSRLRGEDMCYEKMEDQPYIDQLVDIFARGLPPGNRQPPERLAGKD